jgi:starch synthase
MEKKKLLYITSEIEPFNQLSTISNIMSHIPNQLAALGMDVRILMPRFGTINERRNRLHEVVRLSGINVMFNDEDFALTVKVASLPNSRHRLQVYFLHNDEFFKRKYDYRDENNRFYEDNSERMIFFNRGVMETVKKFGWAPDFILCSGWMTSLVPLYARTAYGNDPIFSNSKILTAVFGKEYEGTLEKDFLKKAQLDEMVHKNKIQVYGEGSHQELLKGALSYSDGIVIGTESIEQEVLDFVQKQKNNTFDMKNNDEKSMAIFNFINDFKPTAKGA